MAGPFIPDHPRIRRTARRSALPLVAVLTLLVSACAGGGDVGADERTAPPSPAVEALAARVGALPLTERLSGVIKAENQVAIYPEISAPVVEVLVRSGEAVERGQPLVRLDADTYRDQLRQAEAAVRLAEASAAEARARVAELEAQVVRTRSLAAEDLVSQLELETQEARLAAARASADQAEARVDQARATVEERRSALDKTLLRAPVAGRVGQRNAEVGMLADTNTLLFVIGNLDSLIVEIPLTERMLGYIDEGMPVEIHTPALGEEPLRAELSRISPFLQQASFSTVGEIDVENPENRLRPGMFVTVDVLYGESEQATLVPTSALWEDPTTGQVGLFVLAPPSGVEPAFSADVSEQAWPVRFQPVRIVAEGRLTVGVSGVAPGDWVVTVGQNLLSDRDSETARVRVIDWQDVLQLQSLQKEDLLRGFLEKQERAARVHGATPPPYQEMLEVGGGGGSEPDVPTTNTHL